MLPLAHITVLLHLRVDLRLCVIPMRTTGPSKSTAAFQKWTHWQADLHIMPKGKPVVAHVLGETNLAHMDMSTMTWVDTGGRVHWKSSARKVTHSSIIRALGSLTSKIPWDLG